MYESAFWKSKQRTVSNKEAKEIQMPSNWEPFVLSVKAWIEKAISTLERTEIQKPCLDIPEWVCFDCPGHVVNLLCLFTKDLPTHIKQQDHTLEELSALELLIVMRALFWEMPKCDDPELFLFSVNQAAKLGHMLAKNHVLPWDQQEVNRIKGRKKGGASKRRLSDSEVLKIQQEWDINRQSNKPEKAAFFDDRLSSKYHVSPRTIARARLKKTT